MTYTNPADTRREYKRTQEAHQKPRPQPRGDTRRGDQPPPTKRSRAPDHARHDRGQNVQPPARGRQDDQNANHNPRKDGENMKYEDFTRGFIFQIDGETYTATDSPSNNGNFKATDSRGAPIWLNVDEVIRRAEYQHPARDEYGRKICRKCGIIIINGENGAAFFETCTTCRGGAPRYPKPSSHARTTYSAEESDILEARATSINFDYD